MHPIRWQSPQPLWARFGETVRVAVTAPDQTRPAILIRKKQSTSTTLAPTTNERSDVVHDVTVKVPLKLYHPAHQRHYIVAANLVCAVPGFPDRTVGTGRREQVAFVLRRILPENQSAGAPKREYGFVKDARGPHWERVPPHANAVDAYAHTVAGEELLPLFPLNFSDDLGHPRRLRAGVIPVGRREEYMGSPRFETALPPGTSTSPVITGDPVAVAKTKKSARKEQLKFDVTEPWKALIRAMDKAAQRINSPDKSSDTSDDDKRTNRRKSALQANEGAQLQSWLILLDFADYLATHVPAVWSAVTSTAPTLVGLNAGQQSLFEWINSPRTAPGGGWQLSGRPFAATMRDALKQISEPSVRGALEGAERTFVVKDVATSSWPPFYYLLAGVREVVSVPPGSFALDGIHTSLDNAPTADDDDVEAMPELTDAETAARLVDRLVQLVMAAVDADVQTPAPPVPFAVQLRDAMTSTPGDPGWFLLRCVYVHCECCGPLEPDVLSAPSQQFQLASFFDSDAPARPIRIALPIDTTPAGLRKHQKNTAFVISDVLCGQVNRLKGLGFVDLVLSVLPWPFHKDLDIGSDGLGPCKSGSANFGMICSLSIPIITICALILLFMIVLVLDIIFHWIPWLIICFPLRFRAKQPA